MAWDNAIVTNVGVEMLKEVLEGSVMTLDYASGGAGTVSAASLMNQTEVSDERAQYEIVGFSSVTGGKRINILLTNENLDTGYQMKQLGIWAHVGNGSTALLAILQDSSGVAIPSAAEIDQFSLNFYAVIAFSWSEGSLVLNTDPSTYVSQQQLTDGLAGKIDKVTRATAGNVPIFLAGGGVADSGKPLTPAGIGAAAQSDMTAAQQAIANLNSKFITAGDVASVQFGVTDTNLQLRFDCGTARGVYFLNINRGTAQLSLMRTYNGSTTTIWTLT